MHRITAHPILELPFTQPEGHVVPVILMPDASYYYEGYRFITAPGRNKLAFSTRRSMIEHVVNLLDYYAFRFEGRALTEEEHEKLLDDFLSAWLYGSVKTNGICPYGLYWTPSASRWQVLPMMLSHVTAYCSYCEDVFGYEPLNPVEQTYRSMIRLAFRKAKQNEMSLYNHLKYRRRDEPGVMDHRQVTVPTRQQRARSGDGRAKAFPHDLVGSFFRDGLRTRTKKPKTVAQALKVRDVIYFMLLMFQGKRRSEPLHLFSSDIRPHTYEGRLTAQVRYYDPQIGSIDVTSPLTGKRSSITRREYLQTFWTRLPRDDLHGAEHAGWKGMAYQQGSPDYYADGYWIHPAFGDLFLKLHAIYINEIRPSDNELGHPYYLVCLDRDNYGKPYTLSAARESFEAACRKIGVDPDASYGIALHGMRHRFGQTAVNLGLSPAIIKQMLHHHSILSQQVYATPSSALVNSILQAKARLLDKVDVGQLEGPTFRPTALSSVFSAWNEISPKKYLGHDQEMNDSAKLDPSDKDE